MRPTFLLALIGAALLLGVSPATTQETRSSPTRVYLAPTVVAVVQTRVDQSHIRNAGLRAGYRFSRLSAWVEATRLDLDFVCVDGSTGECPSRGNSVAAGLSYNGTGESRTSPFLSVGAGLVAWTAGGTDAIAQARFGMEFRLTNFITPQLGIRVETEEDWSIGGGLELAVRIGG